MEVRNYPGLPQPSQQPAREASACGRATAPNTFSWASWGSTAQNEELWQPPGIPLQLHSLWLAELAGWMEGWWGLGLGAPLGPTVPVCPQCR